MTIIRTGSPELLERELRSMLDHDPRPAAEIAYALAVLAARRKDVGAAEDYGRLSLQLFGKVSTDSLNDCAARYTEIGGVLIPHLIHEGVVKKLLADLGVTL
jgi:hypothetical protein